jgi:hypothetical protein
VWRVGNVYDARVEVGVVCGVWEMCVSGSGQLGAVVSVSDA